MNTYETGSRVVISHNPHHEGAEGIVGTVVDFQKGVGFMGCDIVHVRYVRTSDGTEHVMPLATYNLEEGGCEALLARAERHEEEAAKLRGLAEELGARAEEPGR
jgi:hypothetical protein